VRACGLVLIFKQGCLPSVVCGKVAIAFLVGCAYQRIFLRDSAEYAAAHTVDPLHRCDSNSSSTTTHTSPLREPQVLGE
jgi:hypothetical protein